MTTGRRYPSTGRKTMALYGQISSQIRHILFSAQTRHISFRKIAVPTLAWVFSSKERNGLPAWDRLYRRHSSSGHKGLNVGPSLASKDLRIRIPRNWVEACSSSRTSYTPRSECTCAKFSLRDCTGWPNQLKFALPEAERSLGCHKSRCESTRQGVDESSSEKSTFEYSPPIDSEAGKVIAFCGQTFAQVCIECIQEDGFPLDLLPPLPWDRLSGISDIHCNLH